MERLPEPHGDALRPLARLPNFWTVVVVGAAILIAVVFGGVRLGITDVWTESMVFMFVALALGMFSPAAGLLMLIVFIVLDAFVSNAQGPSGAALGGAADQAARPGQLLPGLTW